MKIGRVYRAVNKFLIYQDSRNYYSSQYCDIGDLIVITNLPSNHPQNHFVDWADFIHIPSGRKCYAAYEDINEGTSLELDPII